jgi:hypothetical protein
VSPRVIRRIVLAVFVGAIGGMVAGSIADNNGIAVTFGLISAVAALGLILVTSVTTGPTAPTFDAPAAFDEQAAAIMETRIEDLVAAGADEATIRDLIRDAVRLGRTGR